MSSTSPRGHVVYISYDGMLEPLGESQVVAYLERLATRWTITLISFEKDELDSPAALAMQQRLAGAGISWKPGRYHKRPMWLAKFADVAVGSWRAWRAAAAGGGGIVHVRGYLPALMALPAQRLAGAKLLFDIRGFWADERVDRGHWARGGREYRFAKWWERRFFAAADAVVTLTHAAVRTLSDQGPHIKQGAIVRVIPTCADLQRFTPGPKSASLLGQYGLAGATVFGCVGTMSRAYLRDETLRYLAKISAVRPDVRVLIVTMDDHATLRSDAARAGLDADRLVVARASHAEMPAFVRLIDVGVFFIKPSFSARASAATKFAEFLATGVPVVTTAGVGDSSDVVKNQGVGVVVADTSEPALEAAIAPALQLLGDTGVRARCRDVAERYFDVDAGAAEYDGVYQVLHTRP